MCFNFSHASVQSLGLPAASFPPPIPRASCPPENLCPPLLWSYYTEQVADGHQEHNLMGKYVIPRLLSIAVYFHYLLWITRKLIRRNDSPLCDDTAVCALRSASAHLPYLLLCLSVCVCVGCTEENKGFAGIMPLQQSKCCSKLGVAPSDTWSGLNLGAAQSGVEGWRGHCFRVIIFKSPGRARPRVFSAQFISCFAGWLQEFDKRSVKLRGDCVCGVRACTSVWLFSLWDDSPLPRHSVRSYATSAISVSLWFESAVDGND